MTKRKKSGGAHFGGAETENTAPKKKSPRPGRGGAKAKRESRKAEKQAAKEAKAAARAARPKRITKSLKSP